MDKVLGWSVVILVIVIALVTVGYLVFSSQDSDNSSGDDDSDSGLAGGTQEAGTGGDFSCDADTYNCEDFESQAEAQRAFDSCRDLGYEDIHQLDNDGDGVVCEGLG